MKFLASLVFFVLLSVAIAIGGSAGPYRIDIKSDPAVLPVGRARLNLRLTDSKGKPIAGAKVTVLVQMPGMPMGEREESALPASEPGVYTVRAIFGMAGDYEARVHISGPLGEAQGTLNLSTGQTAESSGGFPIGAIAAALFGVTLLALLARQLRRTGQRVNLRAMLSRQVVVAIVMLGIALTAAVWAVNTQRRPGSMTPLEAQVMDMNAPAPEGVLPVRLTSAESKPFHQSVTYTGQVVGYVEQDVVPRVAGTIVSMPVYVGDHVRKGQVLARLDTTQLDPAVSEKSAGVGVARQAVNVATLEYEQALSQVTQAGAEATQAASQVDEARSLLDAAKAGREGVESQIVAAQADVQVAQAEVASAEADQKYQQQQVIRMKTLFDQGVISKDAWQRAEADAHKSDAAVDRAREGFLRAQAGVLTTKADLKRTESEIAAAGRRLQQAQAQVRSKQAGVRMAESAASAAKAKIGQSQASVSEASAGLQAAATQLGFAELRSEVDGVVTSRLISPGVVVTPGQSLLKVAQVSPIRLQANVPESDLARIKTGDSVTVAIRGEAGNPLTVSVTSVSPSVDPNSRTGVVECVYANSDGRFVPGQFVSMEISLGSGGMATVVPSAAVLLDGGKSFVWLAEPADQGDFTVSRQEVQTAGTAGGLTAIKSGLALGKKVVVSQLQGLTEGARVESSEPAAVSDAQTVEITGSGYNPPSISVPAGKAFKVTFIRRSSAACSPEVIFPDLGIRKALPIDQPVTIDIPAQAAGKELNFTCPMNMLKGKAVAR